MRRITPITTVLGCAAIGIVAAVGVAYAADTHPSRDSGSPTRVAPSLPTPPASLGRLLTSQEIDVLTEGESPDHPWETCLLTGEVITCPDGYTTTWQAPLVSTDGGIHATYPDGFATAMLMRACEGPDDEPTNIPCRVTMRETYVVGGDGKRHDGCVIVLSTTESSAMICRDNTVWPS